MHSKTTSGAPPSAVDDAVRKLLAELLEARGPHAHRMVLAACGARCDEHVRRTESPRPKGCGESDGARSQNQHARARSERRQRHAVQPDRQRLDECAILQGSGGRQLDRCEGIDPRVLAESPHRRDEAFFAPHRIAGDAVRAAPAAGDREARDRIAELVALHTGADGHDLTGKFVTEYRLGGKAGRMAVGHVQVRSANAAATHAQNELALARHRVVERLDDQGLPRTLEHRGLHCEWPP